MFAWHYRIDEDSPISPHTHISTKSPYSDAPKVPPKDRGMAGTYLDYRKDNSAANVPSIARDPPSAPLSQVAPWATEPSTMPSTALLPPPRSFFDDFNDNLEASPSDLPATARTGVSDLVDAPWQDIERRPSIASATTMGSQDSSSKASGGKGSYNKKLATFFGEDVSGLGGRGSRQGSEVSIPPLGPREHSNHSLRTRNNSIQSNQFDGRPVSPTNSRPRTPQPPSSDVVPWVYQNFKVRSFSNCLYYAVMACLLRSPLEILLACIYNLLGIRGRTCPRSANDRVWTWNVLKCIRIKYCM